MIAEVNGMVRIHNIIKGQSAEYQVKFNKIMCLLKDRQLKDS